MELSDRLSWLTKIQATLDVYLSAYARRAINEQPGLDGYIIADATKIKERIDLILGSSSI